MKRIMNKKFRKIGLLLGCAMMLLSACGNKTDEMEAKIKADYFDQETEIGRLLLEYVVIDVKKIKDDYAYIEVTAPNVTDALIEWCENNAFSEKGFENALREALSEETRPKQYQLMLREDGSVEYEEAFCSTMGCGLDEFYYLMQRELITELRGAENYE